MGKPSERKRLKRNARQKAEAKKRLAVQRRQRYREDYPEFVYHTNGATPKFVQAVQNAIKSLNFSDRSVFPEWQAVESGCW